MSPWRRGYTLIELLTVIAVLMVLVSLGLPAMRSVREHARMAGCLSNLQRVGQGVLTYALDNNQRMVPGERFVSDYAHSTESWETILVKHSYLIDETSLEEEARGMVNGSFLCPSGSDVVWPYPQVHYNEPQSIDDPRGTHGVSHEYTDLAGNVRYVHSYYGLNMSTGTRHSPFTRLGTGYSDNHLWRLQDITNPSQMVVAYDGIWTHNTWKWYRINGRHRGGTITNVLKFDGRVASLPRSELPVDSPRREDRPLWYVHHQWGK